MAGRQAGLAVGAGVASALLFVVSAKGTALAAIMAYFTALPVIIAALAFGHLSGLGAAIVGGGAVTIATSPVLGLFYLVCFALPGWWLAYLAMLARPAVVPPGPAAPRPPAPELRWYPVGRLMVWIAALSAGAVLVVGALAMLRFGGYEAASAALARRLNDVLGPDRGRDGTDLGLFLVRLLPIAMAASLVPMLSFNLWLGARIAQTSQRLGRPWPNVPDGLVLPRLAVGVFVVSPLPALLSGAVGTAAGVVAATLGLAFAFQGLAAAHVLTRGFAARRGVLGLIYLVTFFLPLAVVALVLIGVVDSLFPLRTRRPPAATA